LGTHSVFRPIGLLLILAAFLAPDSHAVADKIGGSNLPSTGPALKGRIADRDSASSVVVLGAGGGATTNAGPTLLEIPSAFLERAFGYAQVVQTDAGQLDIAANWSDRIYTAYRDADELAAKVGVSLTKDWGRQQSIVAVAFSTGRDVEERLMDSSVTLEHAWTEGRFKPYGKIETALLDYRDVPGDFQPFSNQDDRDRISSRAQAGFRLTLTDHWQLEAGGGVDGKHYLERFDDFGLRRSSVSYFPLIGLIYAGANGAFRAAYIPFKRHFRDDLFHDGWTHGYSVEGEIKLLPSLKAMAAARYGFEETDFLIASAAYERVMLAGLVWTAARGTISFAVSQTWRAYDGLELVDLFRADEKLEVALSGEMPLTEAFSLNGRISYLDYRSSFGDARTDALTASVGLTYATAQ